MIGIPPSPRLPASPLVMTEESVYRNGKPTSLVVTGDIGAASRQLSVLEREKQVFLAKLPARFRPC
jgi:hypothetical protein